MLQGREAVVTVQARYYFGQPVANAQLRYVVNRQPYYSPLRWDGGFEGGETEYFYGDKQIAEGTLRLDADGKAELRIPLPADEQRRDYSRDYSARIEAQVMDAANREVSGTTIVHATYGTFMLSAQTAASVFRSGSPADISVRAIDYAGAAQANVPVALTLEHLSYRSGYYSEPTVTTIANTVGDHGGRRSRPRRDSSCRIAPARFRVRAAAPSAGRTIEEAVVDVGARPERSTDDSGDRYLELMADRKNYEPGESARLIVRGETITGPVLVTKEGQHVSWYRVLRPTPTEAIEVPIEDGDVGDVFVSIAYLREGRLHRAERRLGVAATSRTLRVAVTADQAVSRPREPGMFNVMVTDHAGQPVRAQVSLAVIDEAVYGVKADDTPDPVRYFYRREYTRVATTFSRGYYFTGYSGRDRIQLARRGRRPFTLADFKGDQAHPGAGSQGVPRRDLLGCATWSRMRRAAAASP